MTKILKIKGAINRDYTYIVIGKIGSYNEKSKIIRGNVKKFSKIKLR